MTLVSFVKEFLSLLTIVSHVSLVVLVVFLIRKKIPDILKKHAMLIAFIIATTATLGSLFFSEIAHYNPCKLCWFQRIFMYPLVLILGIAIWKKDNVKKYFIPMSVIGALIAGYHYIISTVSKVSAYECSVGASCLVEYFTEFGYVTIPMMALTAFVMIGMLGFLLKG